jgi:hypothetical protein
VPPKETKGRKERRKEGRERRNEGREGRKEKIKLS